MRMLLVLAVVAGCRAPRPLVLDDTDASRPVVRPEPPRRCPLAPLPSEDAAHLAVRCAEEFMASRGGRVTYVADNEILGGGKPPRHHRTIGSFVVESRAFAACDADGAGTRSVLFRYAASATVVDVPNNLTALRISRDVLPLYHPGYADMELPPGCRLLERPDAR
jgi:hypothetical protein